MGYESGGFVGSVARCLIWIGLIKERDESPKKQGRGLPRTWQDPADVVQELKEG